MQVFTKSPQPNISFTVFDTAERMFCHCSNNNSNKICSGQASKLQQSSLTQSKVVSGSVANTQNLL